MIRRNHTMLPYRNAKKNPPARLAGSSKEYRLYVNSWGRDKTQIIGSCRRETLRHDFYVWQNRILFLKFEKFRIPKQTRFRTFVLLLQPSMKPFDQGTSMEFRISWNQL